MAQGTAIIDVADPAAKAWVLDTNIDYDPGGMSGGPAFDSEDQVIGVISTSPEKGGFRKTCDVHISVDLPALFDHGNGEKP